MNPFFDKIQHIVSVTTTMAIFMGRWLVYYAWLGDVVFPWFLRERAKFDAWILNVVVFLPLSQLDLLSKYGLLKISCNINVFRKLQRYTDVQDYFIVSQSRLGSFNGTDSLAEGIKWIYECDMYCLRNGKRAK